MAVWGLGIALGLAGAGANIVVAARSVEKTAQALEDIRALGVNAHGITVDVTKEPAVHRMFTDTIDHMGRLDSWSTILASPCVHNLKI
ncbi:MAG: hypothetical protein Ct9H300mP11_13380 [Chloroflexota bacterium]|nr:MAG: hypothetical protein Ct9H300mP11_13380 [Chloroflexota bacterium]